MEPELIEFLKKRGVPTSVIEKMEDNKVTFYYLKYVYMHWINWGLMSLHRQNKYMYVCFQRNV